MLFEGFEDRRIQTAEAEIAVKVGGSGTGLLLLHGYPQTHMMWHAIAPALAEHFTVVTADLRGYGDSTKVASGSDHSAYSKRAMASDQAAVMTELGFEQFALCGHDRGARVSHRLTLDNPGRVTKLAVLDIVPTYKIFMEANRSIAMSYYHWYFLAQPSPLPETLIGQDPDFYYGYKVGSLSPAGNSFFHRDAYSEYQRCWNNPEMIHSSCEDYRAAATIDLEHDEADLDKRVTCPRLALWGGYGVMEKEYDVLAAWRERATDVQGQAIENAGHFLAEEQPETTLNALKSFLL